MAGDRILAKSQTATEENGIYIAASTAWARANDMDDVELDNITAGLEVYIQEGTASTKKTFVLTTTGTIVLDTTGLTFEEGPTAGAGASIAGSTGGTDNAILRADGTGGSTVKSSGVTISDADLVAGASGVLMPEQATSPSTSAGQGAFWVQDNAPSTPQVHRRHRRWGRHLQLDHDHHERSQDRHQVRLIGGPNGRLRASSRRQRESHCHRHRCRAGGR